MKKPLIFHSIYAKFTMIFLGIWWMMNMLLFGSVLFFVSVSRFVQILKADSILYMEFYKIRLLTTLIFLMTAVVGTVVILIVMRSVVRPIKRLSRASKEIALGNFNVEVKPEGLDEVGQLTKDFNHMARELKSIDLLRKDFVANVSHEFKTPVTSIKGYANLILEGKLTDGQLAEYAEIIARESERLSKLSSNLLTLSELDSRAIREQATPFSLDEQIRKTVLLLEVQWRRKGVEFDLDLEPVTVTAHEHLLQEVWLNLIQNAVKFSHPNGVVRIALQKREDGIHADIEDHGIGIGRQDRERIFERFFKGDRSRSQEGNGLGLVIVKKIVELSNGSVSFTSEQGKGSVFSVVLPK